MTINVSVKRSQSMNLFSDLAEQYQLVVTNIINLFSVV